MLPAACIEPADVFFEKKDFVTTKIANRISRRSGLHASEKIFINGRVRARALAPIAPRRAAPR
jgi:hypothetical protein